MTLPRRSAPRRNDLMVKSDGRFNGMQILNVSERGIGFVVSFVATDARWFSPEDPSADADGWVRDVEDLTGDLELGTADIGIRAIWRERLERWEREACCDLKGFASLQAQTVAIGHPPTNEWVSVTMSAADQDRAST